MHAASLLVTPATKGWCYTTCSAVGVVLGKGNNKETTKIYILHTISICFTIIALVVIPYNENTTVIKCTLYFLHKISTKHIVCLALVTFGVLLCKYSVLCSLRNPCW